MAAQFRYGTTAEPLRIRAFAQMIAKVLFLTDEKDYQSVGAVIDGVEELTGGARPARHDVEAAIQLLDDRGLLRRKRNGKLGLKGSARRTLADQLKTRRERVDRILQRHFPESADRDGLAAWLDQMSVSFFVRHSDKWVASMTRGATLPPPTEEELAPEGLRLADELNLSVDATQLLKGFERFIKSDAPEDNQHLWSVGMAAFAARLSAAALGPDPITAREIQGRTFLLDTNVLIAIALERDRWAPSFAVLARVLRGLGVTLRYTYETKLEYQGVFDGWRKDTLYALERQGPDAVREASDDWIRAAVARGCFLSDDYSVFFDELRDPPGSLASELEITLRDDPEIAAAARRGLANERQILEIQNFWGERRKRPKKREAASHDSALTTAARELSEDGATTSVLTLDGTMPELALRWSRPLGEPTWISLDALIQVLALDSANPSVDSTEFAPLLMALISNDFELATDEYQIEDLKWLDELERDVQDLPPAEVRDLAKEIHRRRLGGSKRTDPELRLALQRAYQRVKGTLAQDVVTARQAEVAALNVAEGERRIGHRYRAELVRQEVRELRKKLRIRWGAEGVVWVVLSAALGALAFHILQIAVTPGDLQAMIEVGARVLAPAGMVAGLLFKRVFPGYKADHSQLPARAEKIVEQRTAAPFPSGES